MTTAIIVDEDKVSRRSFLAAFLLAAAAATVVAVEPSAVEAQERQFTEFITSLGIRAEGVGRDEGGIAALRASIVFARGRTHPRPRLINAGGRRGYSLSPPRALPEKGSFRGRLTIEKAGVLLVGADQRSCLELNFIAHRLGIRRVMATRSSQDRILY